MADIKFEPTRTQRSQFLEAARTQRTPQIQKSPSEGTKTLVSSFDLTSQRTEQRENREAVAGKSLEWEASSPIEQLAAVQNQLEDAKNTLRSLPSPDVHLQQAKRQVANGFALFDAAKKRLDTFAALVSLPLPPEPNVLQYLFSRDTAKQQTADRNQALSSIKAAREAFVENLEAISSYMATEPSIHGQDIRQTVEGLAQAKIDRPGRANMVDLLRINLENAKQGFEKAVGSAATRDLSAQRNALGQNIAVLTAKTRALQFEVDPSTPLTSSEAVEKARTALGGGDWKLDRVIEGPDHFTVFFDQTWKQSGPLNFTETPGSFGRFAKTTFTKETVVNVQAATLFVARVGGEVTKSVGKPGSFTSTDTKTV